jgi:hypothetical protein
VWELLDVFESNESVSAVFDTLPRTQAFQREYMRELRHAIRELERMYTGDATMSFYIGRNNRLMRVTFESDLMNIFGERTSLEATLDLGSSLTDSWRLDASSRTDWDSASVSVVWEIRDGRNRFENTLDMTFTEDGRWGRWDEYFILVSDWNHSNGNFDLTLIEDDWGGGLRSEELLTGNFIVDGDSFSLRIDDADFRISASPDADIPDVDGFINIDQWDGALLDRVAQEFFGAFWSADLWWLLFGTSGSWGEVFPNDPFPPPSEWELPPPSSDMPGIGWPIITIPDHGGIFQGAQVGDFILTPSESGYWFFEAWGEGWDDVGDPTLIIFDELGTVIAVDEDTSGFSFSYIFEVHLYAGHQYTINVLFLDDDGAAVGDFFLSAYR